LLNGPIFNCYRQKVCEICFLCCTGRSLCARGSTDLLIRSLGFRLHNRFRLDLFGGFLARDPALDRKLHQGVEIVIKDLRVTLVIDNV